MLVLLAVLWGLIGRRLFAPYEMQTEPVDPSLHTASQNEFWNGDWYGWWIIESGTGDYALSEGGWWDACARIDLGEDGSGTLTLWDDSCEAGSTSPRQACRRRPISRRADGSSRQTAAS